MERWIASDASNGSLHYLTLHEIARDHIGVAIDIDIPQRRRGLPAIIVVIERWRSGCTHEHTSWFALEEIPPTARQSLLPLLQSGLQCRVIVSEVIFVDCLYAGAQEVEEPREGFIFRVEVVGATPLRDMPPCDHQNSMQRAIERGRRERRHAGRLDCSIERLVVTTELLIM